MIPEYSPWGNILFHRCLSVSILLCVSSCRDTFQSLLSVFNFALLFPHRHKPIPSVWFFSLILLLFYFYRRFPSSSSLPLFLSLEYRNYNLLCPMLSIALNNNEIAPVPPHHWWRHSLSSDLIRHQGNLLLGNSQSNGSCEMQRSHDRFPIVLIDCTWGPATSAGLDQYPITHTRKAHAHTCTGINTHTCTHTIWWRVNWEGNHWYGKQTEYNSKSQQNGVLAAPRTVALQQCATLSSLCAQLWIRAHKHDDKEEL